MQQYNDQVEVFCGDLSFMVPVLAYTPATHIEVSHPSPSIYR